MMTKLAVDIALIPPDLILDKLIAINQSLKTKKQEISLSKSDYLPHITMAMGIIEDSSIAELTKRLSEITKSISPIHITANKIYTPERPDGLIISGINLDRTPELQQFHETIMALIKPYFTYEATPEMFVSPASITKLPISFVKGFAKSKAYAEYNPHITLGLGELESSDVNLDFMASRIVLSQLGIFCTARKILFETKLGQS